jgi:hypothetical protein
MRGAEEIPPVTGDVEEDRDPTVRFDARLPNERDSGLGHPLIRGVEVIDAEEESDSAGDLLPDRPGLAFPVRPSEKDARLCAGRPDDHPALGAPVVGERRRVLHEVEPECSGEELDSRVVLIHDHSNQVDLHSGSVCAAAPSRVGCCLDSRSSGPDHQQPAALHAALMETGTPPERTHH